MNKKNSCEIQKYFLRVIFAKHFLAAALPDISSPDVTMANQCKYSKALLVNV
jgi:hypothetical protein